MRLKKHLSLCLLILLACSSKNANHDEVKVFLTEWSTALSARDESIRRFYDAHFVFPKVLFQPAEGLQYAVDLEKMTIGQPGENDEFDVTVPFRITMTDGTISDEGEIVLRLAKTEKGFLIHDMTQQLAMKVKEQSLRLQMENGHSEITLRYDTLLQSIQKYAHVLSDHYDSVVYFAEVNNNILFYVIKGSWEDPYPYEKEKQRDGGDYKMGVVTADNQVIIPVEYAKIYNPNGSFAGMIEVEKDGLRGLFQIEGNEFIPAEFDGIYPTDVPGAFAQIRKGDVYGWADTNGKVSFDPLSHANKKLFQSPVESQAILAWEFRFPGEITLLVNPHVDASEATGVIVYPSFVRDLNITPIANISVMIATNEYGMGTTDTEIKFEEVQSLQDKFFGLISFFMEAGADARGYHNTNNDLLVLDKGLNTIDHLENLTAYGEAQNPCGSIKPSYKLIEPGMYESSNGNDEYNYYKILDDGRVEQMTSVREYPFTKFAKIDEGYLSRCSYEHLEYTGEDWSDGQPNLVLINGMSIEQIEVMRNEIFAEYGFKFKSARWQEYFSEKPWYNPQYDNVDAMMTDTDKHNVKFLLEYQRQHKDQQVEYDSIHFGWAG